MSVPKWKRTTSKTGFIKYLMDLNIRLGKIVGNKPKKYDTRDTVETMDDLFRDLFGGE